MLGGILGDIAGSIYEWHNIKTKEFPLLKESSRFTDDTVLTVATMDCLLNHGDYSETYAAYYKRYYHAGYGGNFTKWGRNANKAPYYSYGNGSAMRIGPVAWFHNNLEDVLTEAKRSASVTHNHPEGIKGAQAAAAASFLIRKGESRQSIRKYIETTFNYNLGFTLDDIRESYTFDVSCQGSVPQALVTWLESTDTEDAIRNAISIGGDSDTIACIAGSIAEAEFGLPLHLKVETLQRLDKHLRGVVMKYYQEILNIKLHDIIE